MLMIAGLYGHGAVRDMLKECAKMYDFNHLHILTLKGVCLDGGPAPYIIMPFMANGSLLAYLNPRNLAAGCSDLKLNLTAVRFRGNTVCTIQGIILMVVWWNDTINDMFNVAASIHDQNLMYMTLFKTQVRKWIRITHAG